jgi:hypothetical protein
MYRRLWWKDARQFWPIWAFLVLVAGMAQLVVYHYEASPESRAFLLRSLAMGWPFLYAYAVGAAAFAGERETGTLALLDGLPASRRVVWAGKVSFAIVSTIALALVLLLLAALDVPPDSPSWRFRGDPGLLITMGVLLLQGLAWGLFCSAIFPSALFAAVVAILLTAISYFVAADRIRDPDGLLWWDLGLTLALLAASLIAFTWGRRRRLWRPWVQLRSPDTMKAAGSAAVAKSGSPLPFDPEAPAIATAAIPAPAPGRVIAPAIWSADRPWPRSRSAELRFLVWQTIREGRSTWLLLLAIGLIGPALMLFGDFDFNRLMNTPLPLLGYGAIALVAGVSVFGLETRRRTQRWLVHHGARPGLVWLAKLVPWLFGLVLIVGPQAYLALQAPAGPAAFEGVIMLAVGMPLGFAVATLCGMAIPRGITAAVVAMVIALVVVGAEIGLVQIGLVPVWGLLIPPAAPLLVTWAWSGDWLLDRPAPGRWIRLGLWLAATLGITFAGYAGWRVWSVPDVGPIPRPSVWAAATAPLPEDRNAAGLYREAGQRFNLVAPPHMTQPAVPRMIPDLDLHPELFELIRRAAARPECRFYQPDQVTLVNVPDPLPMGPMADAVAADARRRLGRGDLATAWDDILILFRMARHQGQGATLVEGLTAMAIEKQALGLAREWSGASGQTADRLHAAIAAYRDLPPMTPAADVIRSEGLLNERSIGLPIEDLRNWIADLGTQSQEPRRVLSTWELLRLDLVATPWERARARRLNRLFTSQAAQLAELEPWQRTRASQQPAAAELGDWLDGRPVPFSLLAMFQPFFRPYHRNADSNEAERRATLLVLAAREWQLRHGGKFPDRLDELVPGELPNLPLDPFTGRSFGYTTFARGNANRPSSWPRIDWPPETRLIYSAGTDGQDNGGEVYTPDSDSPGDLVFPIPSHAPGPGGDSQKPE